MQSKTSRTAVTKNVSHTNTAAVERVTNIRTLISCRVVETKKGRKHPELQSKDKKNKRKRSRQLLSNKLLLSVLSYRLGRPALA